MFEQTGWDAAVEIGHKAVDWAAMLKAGPPELPDRTHREILLSSKRIVATVVDALAAAGLLRTSPEPGPSARGDVYVYRNTESLLTPTTKEVAPGVSVDGNDDGLVGVEVLDAVLVEIDGHPVVDGHVTATVLPPPPEVDAETGPAGERPGALRILAGDHLFVKLAQPASEPWHLVYCPGDQRLSGWQSDEDMVDAAPAGRIPVELAGPDSSTLLAPRTAVSRAQVREAAHALFMWNTELPNDPRFVLHHVTGGVDREPYGALVDEVLHHLGITVQEGQEHA